MLAPEGYRRKNLAPKSLKLMGKAKVGNRGACSLEQLFKTAWGKSGTANSRKTSISPRLRDASGPETTIG